MADSETSRLVERTKSAMRVLRHEAEKRTSGYGEWYFASVWELGPTPPKHFFSTFFPVKKGVDAPRKAATWQYGDVTMMRGLMPADQFWSVIEGVTNNQTFTLPGLPISVPLIAHLEPMHSSDWFASTWPIFALGYALIKFRFQLPSEHGTPSLPPGPAVSAMFPLFPSISEAIQDFCGTHDLAHVEQHTGFQVLLPDYRARIRNVRLSSSRVRIECEVFETDPNNFIGKLYLRAASGPMHHDFNVGSGVAEIETSGFPQHLIATIVAREDSDKVDEVRYAPTLLPQPGIDIEVGPQDLDQIILGGESETLEFKRGLPKEGKEIAISVVAMANTSGGTILLGVDDNASITGFSKPKPEGIVRDLLRQYCDPPLEPKVEVICHPSGPVIRIAVTEGADKPYTVKGTIYVRSGSTDRIATRYEIDQMTRNKGPLNDSSFWASR